jgi:hypothetical protein
MTAPDRQQLKRDLSGALRAIQQDRGALGLAELLIWTLVRVLNKLERGVT